MTPAQVAAMLDQLLPVLEQTAGAPQAHRLSRIAKVLGGAGKTSLATIAKRIEKTIADGAPDATSALLETMASVFKAAGASAPAKDLRIVAMLLARLSAFDTEVAASLLCAAIAPPAKTASAKKSQADAFDVRKAADDLTAASLYNEQFDDLLAGLSKQSKQVVCEIAARYLGYKSPYKTKADALKAIRSRQLQDAIQASRERRIDKIAV